MSEVKIKKAYAAIVTLIQENADKTVADILPDVIALASAKTGAGGGKATTFHRDDEGVVVAIFCYYHKKWEIVSEVDYGKKANSPSGLNSMCKEGVSHWTKQQREAKAAESALLTQVADGELAPADIPAEQERIAEEAKEVVAREDEHGFDSLEEAGLE